jgi:hypothetical protein
VPNYNISLIDNCFRYNSMGLLRVLYTFPRASQFSLATYIIARTSRHRGSEMHSSINSVCYAVTAMKQLRQFQEELYCKSQKKQLSDAVDYLVPTHCKLLLESLHSTSFSS